MARKSRYKWDKLYLLEVIEKYKALNKND